LRTKRSPVCKPLIFFQRATVCLIVSAWPAVEEIVTTNPRRRARMMGSTARVTFTWPKRFVSTCARTGGRKLALVLASCSGEHSAPSTKIEAYTAERLVAQLPAGVEGVELAKDGLRAKKGYNFVKNSDSIFAIMRMNDRHVVGYGGCGCFIGVGCIPLEAPGGIWVCHGFPGCIECGLAVTSGDVTTQVFRYTKKG
jgi:hypothetical protein